MSTYVHVHAYRIRCTSNHHHCQANSILFHCHFSFRRVTVACGLGLTATSQASGGTVASLALDVVEDNFLLSWLHGDIHLGKATSALARNP